MRRRPQWSTSGLPLHFFSPANRLCCSKERHKTTKLALAETELLMCCPPDSEACRALSFWDHEPLLQSDAANRETRENRGRGQRALHAVWCEVYVAPQQSQTGDECHLKTYDAQLHPQSRGTSYIEQ